MTPEQWQNVERIFQAALERPGEDRASFLADECAGDEELKLEATSLIEALDQAGDFIEEPALARDAAILTGNLIFNSIGGQIGPYKIVERLGSGGMAEVYLAYDQRLDRLAALKILPLYFVTDNSQLRRFQTEARAASALNHTNIITIYEVGQCDDIHFIAAEHIEGRDFRQLITSEDLSLNEVFDFAIQLLTGLAAAHQAGIVHRDIKPENVMLRKDGVVKILDFGVAKLLERTSPERPGLAAPVTSADTEVGVMIGTIAYMSPEQLRCLPIDRRTDIWSCGVVLYELISRRAPFAGATRADIIAAILEREPQSWVERNETFPAALTELQRIAGKALQKDREQRYQNAAEMLADLKTARRQLDSRDKQISFAPLAPVQKIPQAAAAAKAQWLRVWLPLALIVATLAGVFFYLPSVRRRIVTSPPATSVPANKPYRQMSATEQLAFVDQQEQRISAMMGDRPAQLNDEALRIIKSYVDQYAARSDQDPANSGPESLRAVYARAAPQIPAVARPFAERRIPIVIGIYLPMIESAYQPCLENSIGAKGLFQFLPQTAEQYGVSRAEMCDVNKMAPAAAHYIADRMAELGDDSQSMTLVLLSFNRGAESVRDGLRRLRETDVNYERNFWTLFANRNKLGGTFPQEAGYVPNFFAAAIVGENPAVFGLQTPPLSSLANEGQARKP